MCQLCKRFGYALDPETKTLTKRAKFATNHLHNLQGKIKAWAINQALIRNHAGQIETLQVVETDSARVWSTDWETFAKYRKPRVDPHGEQQWLLEDRFWWVEDSKQPETSPKPQIIQLEMFNGAKHHG